MKPNLWALKRALTDLALPLRKVAHKLALGDSHRVNQSIIFKAANILAAEKIQGDYVEFGVYGGESLIEAYRVLERIHRVHQRVHGARTEADAAQVRAIWERMRFFAFDSFQGLPEVTGVDRGTRDFAEGYWACPEARFRENLGRAGVPDARVVTVPGWFEETCVPATITRLGMSKASIIHIDCDLYSSAKTALEFVKPLLQDGTVIIFDDWFCFRGNPALGEQRAFAEWRETLPGWRFTEYQKEGPWRNSFIASQGV